MHQFVYALNLFKNDSWFIFNTQYSTRMRYGGVNQWSSMRKPKELYLCIIKNLNYGKEHLQHIVK